MQTTAQLIARVEFLQDRYETFVDQLVTGVSRHAVRSVQRADSELAVARERLALRLRAEYRLPWSRRSPEYQAARPGSLRLAMGY